MSPFYSIVIPLYNKELFIHKTLESVLSQTFNDYEIIIVDDGSTDNSPNIVESYNNNKIKLFRKENGGVSSARNLGLRKAEGEYIAFLDADDWWDPNYLERMYNIICENKDINIFCCCYAQILNNGKKVINPVKNLIKGKCSILEYQDIFLKTMESPIQTSAVIISNKIIKDYSFKEGISMGEDLLVWLELSINYKMLFFNEVLSFYNRADMNAATTKLTPIGSTFIPILAQLINSNIGYNPTLLTRLILDMLKPYYLFYKDKRITDILNSCNISLGTLYQRIFYRMPRTLSKYIYLLMKRIK